MTDAARRPIQVVLAGGGTAGHIEPAPAIATGASRLGAAGVGA